MGWEAFEKVAPRPRSAVTLGAHRFGKKNQRIMMVLSVPSHVQPWGLAEFCSIMSGTDEDAGKLAFVGNPEGPYKIKGGKTQMSVRFVVPDTVCTEHTAEVVAHKIVLGGMVVIDLPVWAQEAVRKPLEPAPEEEPPAKGEEPPASAEPAPVPAEAETYPTPKPIAQAILEPVMKQQKRLAPLPSTAEKPIANSKAKDWSPRDPAPSIEDRMPPQRDHSRTQTIGQRSKEIDRQQAEARKLPESKLSQTEIAPAWRKEPGKPEMLVARTDKADISLAGAYLMLGRTPVSVPKHLRAAIALLISRFGEPVQVNDISLVSDKAVALKDLTGLITGKFRLLVDGRQLMLTEA